MNKQDYIHHIEPSQNRGGRRTVGRDIPKCTFTSSNTFTQMVEEGILLVIDEIQKVKNETNQTDACRALIATTAQPLKLGSI